MVCLPSSLLKNKILVDYTSSGASTASVDIRCGNKVVPCTVKKVKTGLLVCSFTPTMAGNHLVDVTIDGLILPGILPRLSVDSIQNALTIVL